MLPQTRLVGSGKWETRWQTLLLKPKARKKSIEYFLASLGILLLYTIYIFFNKKYFDIRENYWLQKTQTLSWHGSDSSTWCARLHSEEGTGETTGFTHLLYTSLQAWCRLVTLMSTQWCYQGLLDNASGIRQVERGILRSCIRPNLCTDDKATRNKDKIALISQK